jgi:serine/threonine protein kinase
MESDRWTRIEQLCQEALERPIEQQTAFLESACDSDVELRREVESLLANRQGADTFMEAGAMDAAAQALAVDDSLASASASRWIGRLIPPYKIVAKVASGGMGDVYRAERADGTFDKQVAIKLIQSARSTDFFLSRFQNERQILATLDHPNIARPCSARKTDSMCPRGWSFFVPFVPPCSLRTRTWLCIEI